MGPESVGTYASQNESYTGDNNNKAVYQGLWVKGESDRPPERPGVQSLEIGGYSRFSFSSALRKYISLPITFNQSAQLVPGAGGDSLDCSRDLADLLYYIALVIVAFTVVIMLGVSSSEALLDLMLWSNSSAGQVMFSRYQFRFRGIAFEPVT